MIYENEDGSLCIYYKGLLISSYGLNQKKTLQSYLNQGEELIYKSKGIPILTQIKTYLLFCNMIHKRKLNKQPIRRKDHVFFLNCITALLRLEIIDNDAENGYYCFPKKK